MGGKKVVVIGGGLVGLAIARDAAMSDREVVVVEKESAVALHQSSGNSGTIHSGIYYKPRSLKSQFCVTGNNLLYGFLREKSLAFSNEGKLIIASSEAQLSTIKFLAERSHEVGVRAEVLGPGEIKDYEPNATGLAALRLSSTGTVNFQDVAAAMVHDIYSRDGTIIFSEEPIFIEEKADGVLVGLHGQILKADALVNAAGLGSHAVAKVAGLETNLTMLPIRGWYLSLNQNSGTLLQSHIYPAPDLSKPFLGVHLSKKLDGSISVGPNAVLSPMRLSQVEKMAMKELFAKPECRGPFLRFLKRYREVTSLNVSEAKISRVLMSQAAELVPEIIRLEPTQSWMGIRAQAIDDRGMLVQDFQVERTRRQLHILNAPSPAATSCLAIGKYVRQSFLETAG